MSNLLTMTPQRFVGTPAFRMTRQALRFRPCTVPPRVLEEWVESVSGFLENRPPEWETGLAPEWNCPGHLRLLFQVAAKFIVQSTRFPQSVWKRCNNFVNAPPTLLSRNGCLVTLDRFSSRATGWTEALVPLNGCRKARFLEIGGISEGLLTCWLLDNILTDDDARLISVDDDMMSGQHAFLFERNIRRSSAHKCTAIRGDIFRSLNLVTGTFDAIYIAGISGRLRVNVLDFALITWPMLKKGGYMLFDSYPVSSGFHQICPQWVESQFQVERFLEYAATGSLAHPPTRFGHQIRLEKIC